MTALLFSSMARNHFPVDIPVLAILIETAQDPCNLNWSVQLMRFAGWVSCMPSGSLYCGILRNIVLDVIVLPWKKTLLRSQLQHIKTTLPAVLAELEGLLPS